MRDRGCWDSLAEDVECVRPVDNITTYDLQWKLVQHLQDKTDMGVMTTNGQHSQCKGNIGGLKLDGNQRHYL
jgi:hypothetical protein